MSKYKELFKKRMELEDEKSNRFQLPSASTSTTKTFSSGTVGATSILSTSGTLSASATLGASATAIRDKFVIEQKITNNLAQGKRAPYYIKRFVEQDKIPEVPRKIGEGSKPLFDRSDVKVNPSSVVHSPALKKSYRRATSSSSSSSSSPTYRKRKTKEIIIPSRKHKNAPAHKKEEKIPYFIDSRREEERLRRLEQNYKELRKSRYPSKRRNRSRSKSRERKRRSRSYSPVSRRKYDTNHRIRSKSKSPQYRSRIEQHIPPVIHVPYPVPVPSDPYGYRMPLAPPMLPYPPMYAPFHDTPRFSGQMPTQYYPGNYRPRFYRPPRGRYAANQRY